MMADPSADSAEQGSDWSTYRRLIRYTRPYRLRLGLGVFFGIICGGGTAGVLVSARGGFVKVFGGSDSGVNQYLEQRVASLVNAEQTTLFVTLAILGMVLLFVFLRGVGFFFSKYLIEWVGHSVVRDLRNQLYGHIQELPMLALGRSRTGELISRTTNDTQMVERGVSTVLGDLAREPFVLIGAVGVMLSIDPALAGICVLLFPLSVGPVMIYGRKVRRYSREGQGMLGDLAAIQQETISGSAIVKAFGMEQSEKERFVERCGKVFNRMVRVSKARASVSPTIEFVSVVSGAVLLLYARWRGLEWDELLFFLLSMIVMYDPVKKLSRLHLGIQQASASADRIFEVLDVPIVVSEVENAEAFSGAVQSITFRDVLFSYGEENVVDGINLDVAAGECIALVGSSGSGKTTLVNLIPRFFDATGGELLINGQNVKDLTISSLRSLIGIVTQETFLFNRTVRENIAYGRPEATEEEIKAAAERAHAHEFILQLADGYDTVIGERGTRLSGGQRQRLSIARALLRNPPILILDEATSALDTESERHVQAALDELMTGRTVFAIAHRLSTIQHADRILVLKGGKIVEEGGHQELLDRGGEYKYFYDLQFSSTS